MNGKKGYIRTGIALLVLGACVAAALLVPEVVSGWYEKQSIGQTIYENVFYEPYEIRYYDSFEEKLDAIAAGSSDYSQIYTLQINERTKNITNEELVDFVNAEFADMYAAGLLPEETQVSSISRRAFYEVYTIVDRMDEGKQATALQNIYFWRLECETENFQIIVRMDSEYHKIYTYMFYEESEYGIPAEWEDWHMPYMIPDVKTIERQWRTYWELPDESEYAVYEDGAPQEQSDIANGKTQGFGDGSVWFTIRLHSGNSLGMSAHFFGTYGAGWGINAGLEELRYN